MSNASTSQWKYVQCTQCDKRFENESDRNHHQIRNHKYGEYCNLYPCDNCGFSGGDIDEINHHIENYHKSDKSSVHYDSDYDSDNDSDDGCDDGSDNVS